MNRLRVVIIEDEIPAARLLQSVVGRLRPNWVVLAVIGSIEEAVLWFEQNSHPDIIFLDIQLSDGNSFDFLSQAQPSSVIIFTTAYDQYAIRAFSVNSIDYILKPIDEKRVLESIIKYESLTTQPSNNLDNILYGLSPRNQKRYRTRFLISGVDQFWTLQVDDIAYFYCENKITFAVTDQGSEHIIDLPLDKLSQQLNPDRFFRANRQVILCINSIRHIDPYFNGKIIVHIKPSNRERITISKEKVASFKSWLNF